MARTGPEIIKTFTGSISTLTGALVATGQFVGSFKDAQDRLPGTHPAVVWAVIAILVIAGVRFLWHGLSRKSRLLRPEVLLIDPDNPQHLKGREDNVRALRDAVRYPLVFLEGESGVGKSALLRSGLMPALTDDDGENPLLPLYISTYGSDWETGPEAQFVDALWQALTEDQRKQLGLATLDEVRTRLWPAPDDDGSGDDLLSHIHNELGKMPLAIFDQFDDYQAEHSERFLRGGQWINVKQLTANKRTQNSFWAEIRSALEHGTLHCLFVTRKDALDALEAVRFITPQVRYLPRIEPAYIIALLEEIMSPQEGEPAVVASPEAGWDALKERLVSDLAYQRRILPIQARTALKGLIGLPYLSLLTYEQAGRLKGLEAAYVEDGVSSAATRAGLGRQAVLSVLLGMVDESNPETPKTHPRSQSCLVEQTGLTDRQMQSVLSLWAQKEVGIVRERIAGETHRDADASWSLYHDYLAHAVLAAKTNAERMQQLLNERQRQWDEATTWRERWRALLSPWQLLCLLLARCSGKAQLRGAGPYMAWSSASLLPYLAVLALALVGLDAGLDWQARADAQVVLAIIRGSVTHGRPSGEEVRQLWELASGSDRRSRCFVLTALDDPSSHSALIRRLPFVSQAIFGIDPGGDRRRNVLELLLDRLQDGRPSGVRWQAHFVWAAHICQSAPTRFAGESALVAEQIVAAVQKTAAADTSRVLTSDLLPSEVKWLKVAPGPYVCRDRTTQSLVGEAFRSLSAELSAEQAKHLTTQIVQAMHEADDEEARATLGAVLSSLGGRLSDAGTAGAAKVLAAAIRRTTDDDTRGRLVSALHALGAKLPEAQAAATAEAIVRLMERATDHRALRRLGSALGSLGARLPAAQTVAAVESIVTLVERTTDRRALHYVGATLGSLGARLPSAGAAGAATAIMMLMKTTTKCGVLPHLGCALGSMVSGLSDAQAEAAGKAIVTAMWKTNDAAQLAALGSALGSLGSRLPNAEAEEGAARIEMAMISVRASDALVPLASAFGSLQHRLSKAQTERGAKAIAEALVDHAVIFPSRLRRTACDSLGDTLPPVLAAETARATLALMQTTTEYRAAPLGYALGSLGARLPDAQAAVVAESIVAGMERTSHCNALMRLVSGLGSLGAKLPDTQAAKGAKHIVAAMRERSSDIALSHLGLALSSLGAKLPDTQAAEGARLIVAAMRGTADWQALKRLGSALTSLRTKVPDTLAMEGAEAIVAAMRTASGYALRSLGSVLGSLGTKLPPAHAQEGAEIIAAAMTVTDHHALASLGQALGSLGARLPVEQGDRAARTILDAMTRATDYRSCEKLAEALATLETVKALDAVAVEWLKGPLAVDEARTAVLSYAGRVAGREFPNLESFVTWAAENRPDLDLVSPPKNPFGRR